MTFHQMLLGVGAVATKTYVDDLFNTFLYKGDGSTSHTINTGFDLSASSDGGMVWFKSRNAAHWHSIFDTVRGANKAIYPNDSWQQESLSNTLNSFNNNGFTVGYNSSYSSVFTNANNDDYASFTFRKAPGFFDVVSWTGNSDTNQTISHSLSSIPGMIIAKRTDSSTTGNWVVYHRDHEGYLRLNTTQSAVNDSGAWTPVTSTSFKAYDYINVNGASYVAYVFAGGESTAATARSVDFDGSGDNLSLAASTDFQWDGDFTVECWCKTNVAAAGAVFNLGGYHTTGGFECYWDSGKIQFYVSNSGGGSASTKIEGGTQRVGQWQHIALVRSGSTVTMYIDGTYAGSYTDSQTFGAGSNNTFFVGSGNKSSGPRDWFNGNISNFRVVKGTAVYTSSFRPPTEPLTNITNTKLLCCNNSSTTGSTVTPGTITAAGDPTASTDSPFDDPAGFKFGDSKEGIIKCGSYVGNGSATGPEIDLGFEPQYLLVKRTDSADSWVIVDSMRGIVTGGNEARLKADSSGDEAATADQTELTPTGFRMVTTDGEWNANNGNYIYMAVRRSDGYCGKPVEIGTSVLAVDSASAGNSVIPDFDTSFPVDFALAKKTGSTSDWYASARSKQGKYLQANGDAAEATGGDNTFDSNVGWGQGYSNTYASWMWKRHAGFDCVNFIGNGDSTNGINVRHGMGIQPEMIWVKKTSGTQNWMVGHKQVGFNVSAELNTNGYFDISAQTFNWASDATTFKPVGMSDNRNNVNNEKYIAFLFGSITGLSKTGTYTGTTDNSTVSVNVGFQPRFVLAKRSSAGGVPWAIFDSVSGPGNGYMRIDSQGARDTYSGCSFTSTGFSFDNSHNDFNNGGETFMYYAHA